MVRKTLAAAGIGAAVMVVAGTPAVLAAGGGLRWDSPNKITNGATFHVASLEPCPPVPTAGDSTLVQITLAFGSGGASATVLPVNSDGSWSADVTFAWSGVSSRHATLGAECLDFTGNTGIPYADYATHKVMLIG